MAGRIILFTASFPFRNYTEEVFLMPELEALRHEFDRIIIVPLERRGEPVKLTYQNVETDTFIADHIYSRTKILKIPYLLRPSVAKHYNHLARESKSLKGFLSGAFFCMNARCFGDLINNWITRKGLDLNNTLFYTFWFDHITSALALMSDRQTLKIVTRAHGHDVYDSQIKFRSHMFRDYTLNRLYKVFPASDNASDYLKKHYAAYGSKISTRILGSSKRHYGHTATAHDESENCWTFFSCARVSQEKRVDRCFNLVKIIATAYPLKHINWIHVGDGPLMPVLKKTLDATELPPNLTVDLRGAVPNEAVHDIYVSEKIDWCMLLSDSEGGCPIALCEALSYAIPVVATEVGGIPEIITPEVGITVPAGISAEAIVGELQPYFNNRQFYIELKSECLKRWERMFCADTLRRDFARELSGIIS